MEVKLITSFDEIKSIKIQWKELEKSNSNSVFYNSYEYVECFAENCINDNESLFIICVSEGDRILGIAPLVIEEVRLKRVIPYKLLKIIGNGDYRDFLVCGCKSESVIKMMLDYIFNNKSKWDRIVFEYIPEQSPLLYYFFCNSDYNSLVKFKAKSPFIDFTSYSNFDELKTTFPKKANKFKSKLMREVGFNFYVEDSDLSIIDQIVDVHKLEQEYLIKEKGRVERRSLFNDEKTVKMIKELFVRGNIVVYILRNMNDEIITYNMCYKYKDILYSWNSAYNHKYSNYRLNKVRYLYLFEYLMKENMEYNIFDFGVDGYAWKFEWTNKWNNVYRFSLWNDEFRYKKLFKLFRMEVDK